MTDGDGASDADVPSVGAIDPGGASGPPTLIARLLQRMPVGVLLVRPDRTVAYRNDVAARLLGAPQDAGARDVPLAPFRRWDGGPFQPGEEPIEATMRSGQVLSRRPVRHLRPDGRVVPATLTAGPIVHDDATVAGLTVLIEPADEPDGATIGETVVGMLSHELRTPVTAIYGGSQLLLRRDLPIDLQTSVLGDIAQEAERLHRLVEDLLAIARTERGLTASEREPVLVQHVTVTVADQERRRQPWADIEVHADVGLPPVRAIEDEVRQVIRNLLANALASGGSEPIAITASTLGDEVVVSVVDRGRGTAAAAGRDAFFLYHRSPAIARQVPGTGVELFVARVIVEALDGRIWVDERPGGGSVVSVALPTFDDPASMTDAASGRAAARAAADAALPVGAAHRDV